MKHFIGTKYDEASTKALDFIKRQMNVNNYSVYPTFKEPYPYEHNKRIFGNVQMPVGASVVFPQYIYCDQFYDETYSGVCYGRHQNTSPATKNLGVEISTHTDIRYVSCVAPLRNDGTWKSQRIYRATEIYGVNGVETKRVIYWYASDVVINSSGSNGIKGFDLKYYAWLDDQGNTIDPDNLPPTQHIGTSQPGQVLMDVITYTLRPTLLDDESIDIGVPFYRDYEISLYSYSDVEYLTETARIWYDQTVVSTDLPTSPPVLPASPVPYIKDVFFSPYNTSNVLAMTWITNFDAPCYLTFGSSSTKTILPQTMASGYKSYQTTVNAIRGNTFGYTITGNGVTVAGTIKYPSTTRYMICGDAQITDEASAANWYEIQKKFAPTLILHMGDQVDSINDSKLRRKQYSLFKANQEAPILVTKGNHDNNDHFLAHFNLPNSDGSDYYFRHSGTLFIILDSNHTNYEKHKTVINNALNSGTYTWAVLILHHSLYSTGSYAYNSKVIALREALSDTITNSPIRVVLSGHEHIMCRTSQPGKQFITAPSSSGSKYYTIGNPDVPWAQVSYQLSKPCCIEMDIRTSYITFKTIDIDGVIVDQFTLNK